MVRIFSLTAAAAALALSTAGAAGEKESKTDAVAVSMTNDAGTPVKLVEFDGEFELLKTSSRLRVWRSHLGYTITVDADGKPTDCALDDEFRRKYVNTKLCSVLLKHHKFEPARDEANEPVAGHYTNRLSYMALREKF